MPKELSAATLPKTGAEFVAWARGATPTLRPLRSGPYLRAAGNLALVDLMAASAALELGLGMGTAGAIANSRAEHFELVVQDLIDRSRWAPSGELRELRGRTLRLSRRAITDIDAIGALGNVLLIVSAKSRVFTEGLARGDHAALQSAAEAVVSACTAARNLMDLLGRAPRGDNYDFTPYQTIVVPVCTPEVIWTPLGAPTIELVGGLRAAVALEELRVFLSTR